MANMKCPKCGREMSFFYGNGWDCDAWYCVPSVRRDGCGHEIVLRTTTVPGDDNDGEGDVKAIIPNEPRDGQPAIWRRLHPVRIGDVKAIIPGKPINKGV